MKSARVSNTSKQLAPFQVYFIILKVPQSARVSNISRESPRPEVWSSLMNGGDPITAAQVLKGYRDSLTDYEMGEILAYKQVYFSVY